MHKLLNTYEAAPYMGVTPKTAENWRSLGIGPKFIRAGGRIVYDPADIESWKATRRVASTSQPVAA